MLGLSRDPLTRDINDRLDLIVAGLAELLVAQGYRGVVILATLKVDADGLLGPFTHKAIARLAGLGWIGKSCMLITPQVGPRVRWATVLTDAPLPSSGAPQAGRCGSCRACVEYLPGIRLHRPPLRRRRAGGAPLQHPPLPAPPAIRPHLRQMPRRLPVGEDRITENTGTALENP